MEHRPVLRASSQGEPPDDERVRAGTDDRAVTKHLGACAGSARGFRSHADPLTDTRFDAEVHGAAAGATSEQRYRRRCDQALCRTAPSHRDVVADSRRTSRVADDHDVAVHSRDYLQRPRRVPTHGRARSAARRAGTPRDALARLSQAIIDRSNAAPRLQRVVPTEEGS